MLERFEMTPSGGWHAVLNGSDEWCVHPKDSPYNIIKHVPNRVATALCAFLNEEAPDPNTESLANFVLEKHGTSLVEFRKLHV